MAITLGDAIREDPGAKFNIEYDLPTGNRVRGTIGPMVGNRITCNIWFSQDPSDAEVETAQRSLNEALGSMGWRELDYDRTALTGEQKSENRERSRRYLREGVN